MSDSSLTELFSQMRRCRFQIEEKIMRANDFFKAGQAEEAEVDILRERQHELEACLKAYAYEGTDIIITKLTR